MVLLAALASVWFSRAQLCCVPGPEHTAPVAADWLQESRLRLGLWQQLLTGTCTQTLLAQVEILCITGRVATGLGWSVQLVYSFHTLSAMLSTCAYIVTT